MLRIDPSSWVENCSGHYSLVGHCDGCFGLEREIDQEGDELIVFGGVSRSRVPRTLILDEDESTLRFQVSSAPDGLRKLLTKKEWEFWEVARRLGTFQFKDLIKKTATTNRKAVSSMLRKMKPTGALRDGLAGVYVVVDSQADYDQAA